jgi:hypothetical protein
MITYDSVDLGTTEELPIFPESYNYEIYENYTDKYLSLYPQVQGIFIFYMEGKSVTDKLAFQQFNLSVECGLESQALEITEDAVQYLEHDKNFDLQEIMDSASVQELFTRREPTRCPIETYKIYDMDDNLVDSDHELYSILGISNRSDATLYLDTTVSTDDTQGGTVS